MATKKTNTIPPEQLALYQKLIALNPAVELKGATMPYTSCNGNMFSFLDQDGMLGLRLPKTEIEAFITKYKTKRCEAHGTVLKEYALVPQKLFQNTKELQTYFLLSLEYVSGLKPKATKK